MLKQQLVPLVSLSRQLQCWDSVTDDCRTVPRYNLWVLGNALVTVLRHVVAEFWRKLMYCWFTTLRIPWFLDRGNGFIIDCKNVVFFDRVKVFRTTVTKITAFFMILWLYNSILWFLLNRRLKLQRLQIKVCCCRRAYYHRYYFLRVKFVILTVYFITITCLSF